MAKPKIAVLADIGWSPRHVGDDAISEATVAFLKSRGFEVLLLSEGVAETRSRYPGAEVIATPRARLARPSDVPASERLADLTDELDAALKGVTGVVVAGGGNLNSTWSHLLHERLALMEAGQALGLPTVVSGQTLGPHLTVDDSARVRRILAKADLLGFRDAASANLARELIGESVPIVDMIDDATFLFVGETGQRPGRSGCLIVATFGPDVTERPDAAAYLAHELDEVAGSLDARVVLVPHQAEPGRGDIDEGLHREIASRTTSGRVLTEPVLGVSWAAGRVSACDLVITSRFHPVVFALGRAKPVVPIAVSGYSTVRMRGVVERWGAPVPVLGWSSLQTGQLATTALMAWQQRALMGRYLAAAASGLRDFQERWWDCVAAVLRGEPAAAPELPKPGTFRDPRPPLGRCC